MSVTGTRIGKKAVKIANSLVNITTLIIILLLVAFSCYALWDSGQVYQGASSVQYEAYKPGVKGDEKLSLTELQTLNPEVFSWLTVYGTHIDYPITQSDNNMKYVNTNAFGEYSLSGNIFLDSNNASDYSDYNSIFYGHHMEKQAMFGEIGLFADKEYFDERPYGNLYYQGEDHGLEFFAFLHADAYDKSVFTPGVKGESQQREYLENLLAKAKFTRDIGVTIDDRIVLLSTCSSSSTNGRDILIGRITDTLYEDSFNVNKTDDSPAIKVTVDSQSGFWASRPPWLWILAPALFLLILLLLLLFNKRKKRGSIQDDEDENQDDEDENQETEQENT